MDLKKSISPKTAFIRTIMFCPAPKTFQVTHCHFSHFISASDAHIWYLFILLDFIFRGVQFSLPNFHGLYDKVTLLRNFQIYRICTGDCKMVLR